MHIGNSKEYVEIIKQEIMPTGTPSAGDVRVKVNVRLKEFSGAYGEVWFDKQDLYNFLRVFAIVVETRKGKARITSMSPDEFWIEFRSYDNLGHFEVEVYLKRFQYSDNGPTYWPTIIAGGFGLDDPSTLPEIEEEFKRLASQNS